MSSVYWVLDGYHDIWNRWAVRQVRALHAANRMFEERDHVHTLLYRFAWEHRREPDGVPIELALDHPYKGFVPVWVDRADEVTNDKLWESLRTELLPGLLPGSDAGLVAAFTPLPLLIDAPGDVPRQEATDRRTLLLFFLDGHPTTSWEPVIVALARRLETSRPRLGGRRPAVRPDDPGHRHLHRPALALRNVLTPGGAPGCPRGVTGRSGQEDTWHPGSPSSGVGARTGPPGS